MVGSNTCWLMICESPQAYFTVLEGPSGVHALLTGVEPSGNTEPVPRATGASTTFEVAVPVPPRLASAAEVVVGVALTLAQPTAAQAPKSVSAVEPTGRTVKVPLKT